MLWGFLPGDQRLSLGFFSDLFDHLWSSKKMIFSCRNPAVVESLLCRGLLEVMILMCVVRTCLDAAELRLGLLMEEMTNWWFLLFDIGPAEFVIEEWKVDWKNGG